jgi:DNA-binding transcriptional LysR family regulator
MILLNSDNEWGAIPRTSRIYAWNGQQFDGFQTLEGMYRPLLADPGHLRTRDSGRVAREVLEPSTIIGLVAAGVGVAIVPDGIQCIQLRGAIYKNLTDISAYSALYLARRQDDPNTHLRAIRDMLAATGLPQQRQRKRATPRARK